MDINPLPFCLVNKLPIEKPSVIFNNGFWVCHDCSGVSAAGLTIEDAYNAYKIRLEQFNEIE